MRTTLTLDDDLARELQKESRRTGKSFKEIVNGTLRRGLTVGAKPKRSGRFRVEARSCGFRPGVDLNRLNQLTDEIEIQRVANGSTRDR